MRERDLEAADHGEEGDGRVYGQKQIVCNDERPESACLGDGPGLVSMLSVVPVEESSCDKVDGGDGQRHLV